LCFILDSAKPLTSKANESGRELKDLIKSQNYKKLISNSLIKKLVRINMKMNWDRLKNSIYAWDGGWLDIYIHNTSAHDWENWVRYINQNFKIDWYNGKAEKDESKIDFSVIQEYWNGNHALGSTAKIFIAENIQVNTHFFEVSEIEHDIDPREFKSIEDHDQLIEFLTGLSKELKREVTVTPENCPEIILMKVQGDSVGIETDTEPSMWPIRTKK